MKKLTLHPYLVLIILIVIFTIVLIKTQALLKWNGYLENDPLFFKDGEMTSKALALNFAVAALLSPIVLLIMKIFIPERE